MDFKIKTENDSNDPPHIAIEVILPEDERRQDIPRFTVGCERGKEMVHFHESTVGGPRGGSAGMSGIVKLDELNAEMLQAKMGVFVQKIFKPW